MSQQVDGKAAYTEDFAKSKVTILTTGMIRTRGMATPFVVCKEFPTVTFFLAANGALKALYSEFNILKGEDVAMSVFNGTGWRFKLHTGHIEGLRQELITYQNEATLANPALAGEITNYVREYFSEVLNA